MVVVARKLQVEIVGDASSLQRAFGKASKSSSSFGSSLGKVAKYGALAAGAAGIGGLAVVLKTGIAEFSEASKVSAQTAAVIASTGGAAKVTAEQVDALAGALMRKSGVDDEAIKAGQNMLLTFKSIRNEAGAGNKIFDEATKATLDLSVAMGTDLSQSAIMVGKALNDPVRGLGAMRRVGIQFTDAQEKMIKGMVKSGDVMGAQKEILKELESQFGGSAEAAGKTLPGQLNILKQSFSNLSGTIVGTFAPAFSTALSSLNGFVDRLSNAEGFRAKLNIVWTGLEDAGRNIAAKVREALEGVDWTATGAAIVAGLSSALQNAQELAARISAFVSDAAGRINWEQLGLKIGPGLASALVVAFATLMDPAFWARNWEVMLVVAATVFRVRIAAFAVKIAKDLATRFRGAAVTAMREMAEGFASSFPVVTGAAGRLVPAVIGALRALPGQLRNLFALGSRAIGQLVGDWVRIAGAGAGRLVTGVLRALERLAPGITGHLRNAVAVVRSFFGAVWSAAVRIGQGLADGVISGIGNIGSRIYNAAAGGLKSAIGKLKSLAEIGSPSKLLAREIGRPLADGIVVGMDGGLALLAPKMQEKIKAAVDRAAAAVEGARGRLSSAFGSLSSRMLGAFDAQTGGHMTPAEQQIAAINDARRQADLQKALSDAQATGDATAIARAMEDIKLDSLQKQAAEERKAYTDQRATMRENLEARIGILTAHFQKEGATIEAALKAISKLMARYGVSVAGARGDIGGGFAGLFAGEIAATAGAAAGVRGAQTGGNTRPIVVQSILDGKVIAESVQSHATAYQRNNGAWLVGP